MYYFVEEGDESLSSVVSWMGILQDWYCEIMRWVIRWVGMRRFWRSLREVGPAMGWEWVERWDRAMRWEWLERWDL